MMCKHYKYLNLVNLLIVLTDKTEIVLQERFFQDALYIIDRKFMRSTGWYVSYFLKQNTFAFLTWMDISHNSDGIIYTQQSIHNQVIILFSIVSFWLLRCWLIAAYNYFYNKEMHFLVEFSSTFVFELQ